MTALNLSAGLCGKGGEPEEGAGWKTERRCCDSQRCTFCSSAANGGDVDAPTAQGFAPKHRKYGRLLISE